MNQNIIEFCYELKPVSPREGREIIRLIESQENQEGTITYRKRTWKFFPCGQKMIIEELTPPPPERFKKQLKNKEVGRTEKLA